MFESIAVALLLPTAALAAYLAGRLSERNARLTELQVSFAETRREKRALENHLLTRQGMSPIYKEDGTVAVEHLVFPDNPVMQILKPPFAAAEEQWEREEQESKTFTAQSVGAIVPPLSDEDKEAMRRRHTNGTS